jgi:hypothetical protein
MNFLFGAKKKEAPKPVSDPNAPTLTETSNKVSLKIIYQRYFSAK